MPDIGGAGLPRYDVIVVGGGPGGTSAANHLIQRSPGSRVALVERLEAERFSHYHHMCGEGISKNGLKEIGHDPQGVIEQGIDTVVEHWPGGRDIEIRVKGAIIDRALLLDSLRATYEREGGTVIHDSVVRVIPDGPGFEVHLTSGQTVSTDAPHRCRWRSFQSSVQILPGARPRYDLGGPVPSRCPYREGCVAFPL